MSGLSQATIDEWINASAVVRRLMRLQETVWLNERLCQFETALPDTGLGPEDVQAASERLGRFAPYLAKVFPETTANRGVIESPLRAVPNLQRALSQRYRTEARGTLWLKMDNQLPIAGSIKARGGIYEVLAHAETLALEHGLLSQADDYRRLAHDDCRAFFSQYRIAVGSTGNLGVSIGVMGAELGFRTTVHMSADAMQWKKERLRSRGVEIIEYASDYSQAVEAGRRQAELDPSCHFVDDENSTALFLGYAVAAAHLSRQLADLRIVVDREHPLFVYLPCGVGGAPGGVTFGLKLRFGDDVHCVFAEPTHSPCMLLGVHTGLHHTVSVQDFGIDNVTAADGLAVGRPSGFVGKAMQRLITAFYTLDDDELYALLALLAQTESVWVEPSAAAGLPGLMKMGEKGILEGLGLSSQQMENATHIAWATGGCMAPTEIMSGYYEKGLQVLRQEKEGAV